MTETQNRWAVIVGIDKYPSFSREGQLEGCVRDAREIARVLRDRFGFAEKRMTLLLNDEAKRDSIVKALEDLEGRVKEDDVVVVHYSGHGSQRVLPADDKHEPDGLEEVLVPYDTGHEDPFPNRDISGDWIHDWLARMTKITPYVTLILDCCHSGNAHRTDENKAIRGMRRVPPDLRGAKGETRVRHLRTFTGGPKDFTRYVVLAACKSDEGAFEIEQDGKSHGAMSWFLLEQLRNLPAGACPTYRDVFEPVISGVSDLSKKKQVPQLEGLRDRELFGLAELKPRRFVPVRARRGDRVVLGAGATCGLMEKAVLTVYPAGGRDGAEPIGKVEIIEVRAVTSTARILEEVRPEAIGPWARAMGEDAGEDLFHLSPDSVGTLDPWVRYRKILGLRNDDSALARKVDFTVARLDCLQWVRLEDGDELLPGAQVSFALTNRASIPLYVYILDFGLTGEITQLYPVAGACDPLMPGRCIEIGTRAEEEITLSVPDGVEEGEEVLKVFVTTREADLEPLFQTGLRSPRRTREFRSNLDAARLPAEDWTTLEHRFRVRRRVLRSA